MAYLPSQVKYNLTPPTLSDGQTTDHQGDTNGNLKVNIAGGSVGASTADGSTFAQNTTPGTIAMGVYVSSPQTLVTGKAGALAVDVNRNLMTTLSTLLAGEDLNNNVMKVEERFSYANIVAGQATTVVKAATGFLHSITFNSAATATSTMVMYDNTAASGTKIATITATGLVPPVTVIYDVVFATGLTIIIGTANGADMTVAYR